jgi:hypothetical protein
MYLYKYFHKLASSFVTGIVKQSEVNVLKHTYEYLPYNNWTNTRLVQDVLCYTICYRTTNESMRNAQLRDSS